MTVSERFIRVGAVPRATAGVNPVPPIGPKGSAAGCRICGRSLTFHQQVAGRLCGDWRCKAAHLEDQMAASRRQAALALGVARAETYAMVVVPDDPARVHTVPAFRHRAHVNWLFELCVRTAEADPPPDAPVSRQRAAEIAPPLPVAAGICAVCQGTCCHLGGEHAFLDSAAIRAFTSCCGIADPLDIVHTYAARLPRRAVEEGCVYQAEAGCTLPRWMRAAICNAYRCRGLSQAEDAIRDHGARRFFVVVRKDNHIQRSAFIDGDRIRRYPPASSTENVPGPSPGHPEAR